MATTVQQIIEAAYGYSFKNRPDTIAQAGTELVGVVDRRHKQLFSMAAEIDPNFFGTATSVTGVAGVWQRPANAEVVYRIEDVNGNEIRVFPYDDRVMDFTEAAVFKRGQTFVNATSQMLGTETLQFWYSWRPDTLTGTGSNLSSFWVEAFNALLIIPLAAYLAAKDGRADDVALFNDELSNWEALFKAAIEREPAALEVRRIGIPRAGVPTRTIKTQGAGAPPA